MQLPLGFSPVQAFNAAALTPFTGNNYDVLGATGSQQGGQSHDPRVGVYWVGQDGNTWYSPSGGTARNMGQGVDLSSRAYRIDDPNVSQPQDDSGYVRSFSDHLGAGGGVRTPDYTNQARSVINSQLARLPGQRDIALGNIDSQFNVGRNQLDSAFNQARKTYDTQSTTNRQNLVTNRNTINDQASQGLRGLMRVLGAYGAGGSSDRFLVGDAVTGQMNAQMSGAGQNYSTNQQGLDTNWGNFETQSEQERKQLNDWRTQQRQQAESQYNTNRQDLLYRLANLGGDNAQQYINEANAMGSQIDALARFNPTYTGNTPVFEAPALSSYQTGTAEVNVGQQQPQGGSPFLSALLGNREERRRQF